MRSQRTSLEAFRKVLPKSQTDRARIFTYIKRWGDYGRTCQEVELKSGWPHQSVSARICELRKQKLIVDSGMKRKTLSGRNAIVWVAK